MGSYTIQAGETQRIDSPNDIGQSYLVRVSSADVRVSTLRENADKGTIVQNGDRAVIEVPPGAEFLAYADDLAEMEVYPNGVNSLSRGDDIRVRYTPTARTEVTGTVSSDVSDRSGRNLGKARLMDDSGSLIKTTNPFPTSVESYNAGTIPVEQQTAIIIGTWDAGTLPVEQQTPVGIEDSTGTQIDPATGDVTADHPRTISTWDAGTLTTDRNDSTGTTSTASTTSTGSANAAVINVPDGRTEISVLYDVSGAATVTVEVSTDGSNWYQQTTFNPDSAEATAQTVSVGADHARVYVDTNINRAEISAKGV